MHVRLRSGGNGRLSFHNEASDENAERTESSNSNLESMVEWLNSMLPNLNLPLEASGEDIRACLLDGTVLCYIMNGLSPGIIEMGGVSDPYSTNVERFLSAMDKMGLPRFAVSDLEQGHMEEVLQCLQTLRDKFITNNVDGEATRSHVRKRWNLPVVESLDSVDCHQGDAQYSVKFGLGNLRNSRDSKSQTVLRGPAMSEPPVAVNEFGNMVNEVLHKKKASYHDISIAKISDLMTGNSLDKAPTQLLFSMVNKVLDESVERKSGDVPHLVACLLRKLVREIEHRSSSQADKIKNQNNLCKTREGKYQSRVRVLETLAVGTAEENEVVMNQLRQMRIEKTKLEERIKCDEQHVKKLIKERDLRDAEIVTLNQELEVNKMSYQKHCVELENQAKETKAELEKKLQDLESLLEDSKNKVKVLEENSESNIQSLKKKELRYKCLIDYQFGVLQGLRVDSDSLRREILKTKMCYPIEFQHLAMGLKELVDAAENYHLVLEENRRLYNEVQDLKGNIRVYCRIRPFLPGQNEKKTTIEYIGENGEIVVTNPTKQGKDTRRLFKFNKVFASTASQEEVFKDTQPLIRSVLDGYNVCIFAYGQTGSGKTYTMSGPDISSRKEWGVNYRALHDLFQMSQNRKSSILYEIGVQMVEIYNEQVRDLLASDGIWSTAQPNGLAVPDASMHAVNSTSDVLELMNIGLMNRAVGATALNERSSRSHSILTVHVRGTELKSNSILRGCLHLVDLAGSERVDRSEATGDRLREAQHINKSLSALGDVIFSLAQKSPHVPYRNSKLTQVLQSSLGGQAKTLMFVQLNPDLESYSETRSTLKFAERVSGVQLGAAHSNKVGRDIRELMEQVASLKETIAKKDEEIDRWRLIKATANSQKRGMSSSRCGISSPRRHSIGPTRLVQELPGVKRSGDIKILSSDIDNCSEYSDKQQSESGSQHSVDGFRHPKESLDVNGPEVGQNFSDDVDLLGFGDVDSEERLSDISDGGLSMGTETDGSMCSVVEYTLFPEVSKQADYRDKPNLPSKIPKPPQKQVPGSSQLSLSKASSKAISNSRKVSATSSSSTKPKSKPLKRWQ
ncbi:hypothetical protein Nepgr_024547 [Nepenthes gracilis]|uniref:Uncharacterized protein n=1 Tax=Nepenthes gracilis TaxID=150966 RepID=A0AAD3T4S6_NEPGR|nr:hypothetical protein Nepgr_024547 [Nepenthes gracilis]